MAVHFSILAQEIPWTEEPGRLQSMESQESEMTERLKNNTLGDSAITVEGTAGFC